MTFPAVQPGVVQPPMDSTERRIAALQRLQADSANRDLTNAMVGQGGSFRATLVDGGSNVLSVQKGAAVYGGKQTLILRDVAAKPTYALDELAGYGLSHPSFTYSLSGVESQGPALPTTVGAGALIAVGTAYIYNPVWHVMLRLRFANGPSLATAIVTGTFKRYDGSTVGTVSQTFNIGANVFVTPTFERMVLMGSAEMGSRVSVEFKVHVNTGPDLSVQAFTIMSTGISRAQYDLLPGLH